MIVLCGKSASGKDFLASILASKYGFHRIVTFTTRPMRKGEKQGETYHFIDQNKFQEMLDSNSLATWQKFNTAQGEWFYGTDIASLKNADDESVIILTPQGYQDVCLSLGYRPFCIYVYSNASTIRKRLMKRGDNKEEAQRRMNADNLDFKGFEHVASKIVHNDDGTDIEEIVAKILKYAEGN